MTRVFAISGSLRSGASSSAVLAAAAAAGVAGITIDLYAGMAALPHFNPDLDTPDEARLPPEAVELRGRVARADALLLSTPEYAHGLPGSFKNVLDWLVGSTEFAGKPAAIWRVTARSVHAPAQLREVLATMAARVVDEASVLVPLEGRAATADDVLAQPAAMTTVRRALAALGDAVARAGAHPGEAG